MGLGNTNMTFLENLGLFGLFLGSALAASIFPFAADPLYLAILAATKMPLGCFLSATLGSWVGSLFTYWIGTKGKWEWIEKWFKVKPETLKKQQAHVQRYGVWLGLLSWVPVVGDIFVLALGFYRAHIIGTSLTLLVGKILRFLAWNALYAAVV